MLSFYNTCESEYKHNTILEYRPKSGNILKGYIDIWAREQIPSHGCSQLDGIKKVSKFILKE